MKITKTKKKSRKKKALPPLNKGTWENRREWITAFLLSLSKNSELAAVARKQRFAARHAARLRPSPALRLCLATRFMAFSHFWR